MNTTFRIRALGRVEVARGAAAADAVLAQPKRLALLVYLACSGSAFNRRDTLVTLFWPELDQARARAALRDSLYFLRRTLDPEIFETRGAEYVRLRPGMVTSDVAELRAALDDDRPGDAADAYGGELMPGFHIAESEEFEEWLTGERRALERAAAAAAHRHGIALASAHDPAATDYLRRALHIEPFDESRLRTLVEILRDNGDVAGALREYEAFVQYLHDELNASPSAETRNLIASIRVRVPQPPVVVQAAHADAPVRPDSASDAEHVDVDGSAADADDGVMRRRPRPRRWMFAAPLAAAVVMLLALLWPRESTQADPSASLLVVPFTYHGAEANAYLAEGLMDLLSASMDGAGDLRTVDPYGAVAHYRTAAGDTDVERARDAARRIGATHFLLGTIVEAGGRIQISAYLYEAAGALVARADGLAQTEVEVFALVDDLTRRLLSERAATPDARVSRIAAATTSSLPALKAYLAGEQHYRAGDFTGAIAAFQEAVAHDTTFGLAYYRLSTAADWMSFHQLAEESVIRARRHVDELPRTAARLVEGRYQYWAGDPNEAERIYGEILNENEFLLDAAFELAETIYHAGPWRGRRMTEAEPFFRRTVELQPEHVTSLLHLARLAALQRDSVQLDTLVAAINSYGRTHERATEARAHRAAVRGDRAEMNAIIAHLRDNAQPLEILMLADRTSLYGGDIEFAERASRLALRPGASREMQIIAREQLAHFDIARGRWDDALEHITAISQLDAVRAAHVRASIAGLPYVTLPDEQVRQAHRLLTLHGDTIGTSFAAGSLHARFIRQRREYHLGKLELALGDTAAVLRRATALSVPGDDEAAVFARSLASVLRALVRWRAGDPARALEEIRHDWLPPSRPLMIGWPYMYSHVEARFIRGAIALDAGDLTEASAWMDGAEEDIAGYSLFVAPASIAYGEIHERRGDRAAARAAYTRAATLLRGADPEFRPMFDQATARLRAIGGN